MCADHARSQMWRLIMTPHLTIGADTLLNERTSVVRYSDTTVCEINHRGRTNLDGR